MLDKWSKVLDGKRLFDFENEDLGIASDAKKLLNQKC